MDTLTTVEAIGTDNKDKPVQDIVLERIAIFVDPFQEVEDELKAGREAEVEAAAALKKPKKADKTERKVTEGGEGRRGGGGEGGRRGGV